MIFQEWGDGGFSPSLGAASALFIPESAQALQGRTSVGACARGSVHKSEHQMLDRQIL